jgi:hypothetical protein
MSRISAGQQNYYHLPFAAASGILWTVKRHPLEIQRKCVELLTAFRKRSVKLCPVVFSYALQLQN